MPITKRFLYYITATLEGMKEPSKTDENPYLALRRAKIARNETRMRELGLLKRKRSEQEPSYTATALKKATKPKKEVQAQSVRRSSRLQRTSPQSVVEEVVVAKAEQKRKQNVSTTKKKSTSANQKPQIFPAHSARSMTLNVGCLVQNLLGKPMEYTGKQFVMEESARLAVEGHDGGRISFNKYCGVQEWGNDCMFLWVNLGPPKSDVVNEFLDEGRQVTWFGGSRMHNETAAICKLKRVGSASNLLPENGIVLWCRQYIPAKKTFSSYVCMGRLSLVSYNPDALPLAFVWKLLDYDTLANGKDEAVQKTFRDLSSTEQQKRRSPSFEGER